MIIPKSNLKLRDSKEESYYRKAYLSEMYDCPVNHLMKQWEGPFFRTIGIDRRSIIELDARQVYAENFLDYALQLDNEPRIEDFEPHPIDMMDAGDGLHKSRPRCLEPNQEYGIA
jgi:hypothetical protein